MEYDRDLIFYFLLPFLVLAEGDMDGSIFWPAEISGEGMGKEKERKREHAYTRVVGNVKVWI